ncbi:kinase-like domain-containing protein [Aspergillus pseudoustus]|uniref:Kinase-like domain-containing protein n=1 Tax=Aspergillus pseudoustus TaxID=1810923 RepID=A0ABR4KWH1_9EURO
MRFLLPQRSLPRFLRTWGRQCPLSGVRCSNLLARPILYRTNSTLTDTPIASETYTPNVSDYKSAEYIGETGRTYQIEEIILIEDSPFRRVFFASSEEGDRVLVKYIEPEAFENHLDVNDRLWALASHVRLAKDLIPGTFMFVYELCDSSFSQIIRDTDPSPRLIKRILKSVLSILAEFHDRDILHGVMMASTIFVNWNKTKYKSTIDKVKLGLSKHTTYIRPGSNIVDKLIGTQQWRSPEACAMGPVNKPSDIFSFALLCIYAVKRRHTLNEALIEDTSTEDLEGTGASISVLERQMSYFADKEGLRGFLNYLGKDHPLVPVIELAREGFNVDRPREPFSRWEGLDEDFRDLILSMTNFDPTKRITARQALEHRWFQGVEVFRPDFHSGNQEFQPSRHISSRLVSEIDR